MWTMLPAIFGCCLTPRSKFQFSLFADPEETFPRRAVLSKELLNWYSYIGLSDEFVLS